VLEIGILAASASSREGSTQITGERFSWPDKTSREGRLHAADEPEAAC
jgi:hypothetical protein